MSSSTEQAAATAVETRSYHLTSTSPATIQAFKGGHFEELDSNYLSPGYLARKSFMDTQMVGQEPAKAAMLRALERADNPLRDPTRPISIIYLLGDSRNGKGLLVECASFILHQHKERHHKVNGGSYKASHEASRLVGSAPGLIGFHEESKEKNTGTPGKLSNASLQASRGDSKCPVVILFIDEADLLHYSLDDVMMSIFDKGQLDMGNNQVTDFRNVIIVLAGNLGLSEALKRSPGFGTNHGATKTHAELSEAALEAYEKRYSLPWRNRVDDVVVMEPFTSDQIDSIVQMELDKFKARMSSTLKRDQMFELSFDNLGRRFIFESAMKSEGKVAEIKRLTQRLIIDRLGPQIDRLAGNLVIATHKPGARDLTFILMRKPNDSGSSGPGAGQPGSPGSSTSREVLTVRQGTNLAVRTATVSSNSDAASIVHQLFFYAAFGLLLPFVLFGGRREAA